MFAQQLLFIHDFKHAIYKLGLEKEWVYYFFFLSSLFSLYEGFRGEFTICRKKHNVKFRIYFWAEPSRPPGRVCVSSPSC